MPSALPTAFRLPSVPRAMANNAIISIGSNINAEPNIAKSIDLLGLNATVVCLAPHLTTEPIGITDQPAFVNTAVAIDTDLELADLVVFLKKIEDQLGRDRTRPKFGPREIDLDVLAWNGQIIDDDYYHRPFLQRLYAFLTS